MTSAHLHGRAEEAAVVVRESVFESPRVAIVLGSGLGTLVEQIVDRVSIPYTRIPHFPQTTIAGHAGNLVAGRLGETPVWALQGRFHYYEGHDLDTVTFPIRVMQVLGVQTLILTAATGSVRIDWRPGTLVCLSDHLNLLGENPLRGPNNDRLGPRFPDMTNVYSPDLRALAHEEAVRARITLHEGIYACMSGPSYETPAEIRMIRGLGADVVGMLTVPEAIVARHGGMQVLAFALVTNAAAGVLGDPISHDEVLEAGREAGPRLGALIAAVVQRLGATDSQTSSPAAGERQDEG